MTDTTKDDGLQDKVLEIACLFMGFTPNPYWKGAVGSQHPEQLRKAMHLIKQYGIQERIDGINELKTATLAHLERIEKREGGGMLDLYAISGALSNAKDAAFARDRLVSERRAVSIVYSIAAELTALKDNRGAQ